MSNILRVHTSDPSSPALASYELVTALEIHVGLNYILTGSMRGGRLRAWKRIQDPAGKLARFLMRNPNHSKEIRARCSLCVPVCVTTRMTVNLPLCLGDRETKMLGKVFTGKHTSGVLLAMSQVPWFSTPDTTSVSSLFCFLWDDLYPDVRSAHVLRFSVCDLTSRN